MTGFNFDMSGLNQLASAVAQAQQTGNSQPLNDLFSNWSNPGAATSPAITGAVAAPAATAGSNAALGGQASPGNFLQQQAAGNTNPNIIGDGSFGDWFTSPAGLMQGLGAASSIYGLHQANKQFGLQKDIFDWQKGVTEQNLANQRQGLNTYMADRQRGRVLSTGSAEDMRETGNTGYESVESYMDKNRYV